MAGKLAPEDATSLDILRINVRICQASEACKFITDRLLTPHKIQFDKVPGPYVAKADKLLTSQKINLIKRQDLLSMD